MILNTINTERNYNNAKPGEMNFLNKMTYCQILSQISFHFNFLQI